MQWHKLCTLVSLLPQDQYENSSASRYKNSKSSRINVMITTLSSHHAMPILRPKCDRMYGRIISAVLE